MFKAMEGRSASLGPIPRFRFSRQCWPSFLSSLLPAWLWRGVAAGDPRPPDLRRRWSVKYILLAWIVMGWSIQSQASARFNEAREVLSRLHWRRRRSGKTYQGLVKASLPWATKALHTLWRQMRPGLLERMHGAARWADWTVLAADGSPSG
jgi:hypothetical protein